MGFQVTPDGHVEGENGRLEVVFDGGTGGIRTLRNLLTGQVLVSEPEVPPVPWRIQRQGGMDPRPAGLGAGLGTGGGGGALMARFGRMMAVEPRRFEATVDGDVAELRWETAQDGVGVRVRAVLTDDGDLELWPSMTVADGVPTPELLTYPVLTPARLSEDESRDRLAYPAHSGWLVRAPLQAPAHSVAYPDGYHGCSVQMMAYYTQDVGGFYLATHDPHSTHKWLTFSKDEVSFRHDHWDVTPGVGMDLGYPVVISPLTRGDWYEGVDRYRRWAHTAPWAHRGPKWGRSDDQFARWLYEDVGLCLWGTPNTIDWSPWYRYFTDTVPMPLQIASGWDWPAQLSPAMGYGSWFPARFDPANVESWKGHRVTPYMNDLFISVRAPEFLEKWEPNVLFPYQTFSWLIFANRAFQRGTAPAPNPAVVANFDFYMCPATKAQADYHTWRDVTLMREHDFIDGVCYDISSGNPYSRCLRGEHEHTPGSGRQILEAYDRNNRLSVDASLRETGRYPALGVETIIENVIAWVEFYVSRAAAGPLGGLESGTLGPEQPPGQGRELIPLFQAIYHDIGPVHEDGWLTAGVERGDLYYWVAARIHLQWGGLMALHYATNPPHRMPGHPSSALINWDGARHEFIDLPDEDPGKMAFQAELGRARTTFGNRYLGYGRVLRPTGADAGTIELSFGRQGAGPFEFGGGRWSVPRVMEGAWQDPLGNVGVFLANLDASEAVTITVEANIEGLWDIEARGSQVRVHSCQGSEARKPVGSNNTLSEQVTVPPRRVVLVEVVCGRDPDAS